MNVNFLTIVGTVHVLKHLDPANVFMKFIQKLTKKLKNRLGVGHPY